MMRRKKKKKKKVLTHTDSLLGREIDIKRSKKDEWRVERESNIAVTIKYIYRKLEPSH